MSATERFWELKISNFQKRFSRPKATKNRLTNQKRENLLSKQKEVEKCPDCVVNVNRK